MTYRYYASSGSNLVLTISGILILILFAASLAVLVGFVVRRGLWSRTVPAASVGIIVSAIAVIGLSQFSGGSDVDLTTYAGKHLSEINMIENDSTVIGKMAGYPADFNCSAKIIDADSRNLISFPGVGSEAIIEVDCVV